MLTTLSEKISPSSAMVYYKVTGHQKGSGSLEMVLPFESEDVEIIAELVAINYLILEKQIAGENRQDGNGITLNVSKGAIKKIALGKTTKKHLFKFGNFLTFILRGISIKTHKKRSKTDICSSGNSERINVDVEKYTGIGVFAETELFGKVGITYHAMERFIEHATVESGELKSPLKSMKSRISNPDMIKVELPERVKQHKDQKYGESDSVEVWKHPDSTLNFSLARKDDVYTLITVFIRNQ